MLSLNVEKREKGKPETLRKKGVLPAVFYGKKEVSTPVAINAKDFDRVWKEAGESTVITLEGVGESKEALIHDVSLHPVTGRPEHADFYVFEKGQKITVNVPLEFIGESPAVKDLGGILVKVMHEVEIEAMPKDLPHDLKVDISKLAGMDSTIEAKDLTLPEGVTVLAEPEEVIASIAEPKEEEEEEPEDVDMSSIAVEGEEESPKEAESTEGTSGDSE